jgi:hypothetical protein
MLPANHWLARRTPMQVRPRTLEADYYNCLRLGLLRLGDPLRLSLPEIRGLDCIIDAHAWTAVDRFCADQPLFALTGFRRSHHALHDPVRCELRIYHHRAGLILGPALEGMRRIIARRIAST